MPVELQRLGLEDLSAYTGALQGHEKIVRYERQRVDDEHVALYSSAETVTVTEWIWNLVRRTKLVFLGEKVDEAPVLLSTNVNL